MASRLRLLLLRFERRLPLGGGILASLAASDLERTRPLRRGPGLELAPLAEHCRDLDPEYAIPDPDPALLGQALTLAPGAFALQGADLGLPVANGIGKIGPAITEATGGASAGGSKRPLKKKKKRAEQSGSQAGA